MNTIISKAISEHKEIKFYYDGGERIVEPFCYGISTAGNEVLRGFQVGGYSKSGKINTWKLFRVDSLELISFSGNTFSGDRPYYNPNDKAMSSIYSNI